MGPCVVQRKCSGSVRARPNRVPFEGLDTIRRLAQQQPELANLQGLSRPSNTSVYEHAMEHAWP